jgi:hypothetical protein
MAPSPQQRKIHFDCCFFLLVFPWLRRGAEKGARGIMSFKRLFSFLTSSWRASEFICWPERAGPVHTAVRALVTRWPKHLVRAESFGGGGIFED